MKRAGWIVAAGVTMLLASPRITLGQPVRSFTAQKRDADTTIPREHRPPPGMCRVWLDGVPAAQQPAPTDCATAVRTKPKNGRVIFGEVVPDSSGRKQEKPKKP